VSISPLPLVGREVRGGTSPLPRSGRGAGVRVFRLALQHEVLTTIEDMLEAILAVLEET
jgi:hypothetical protein